MRKVERRANYVKRFLRLRSSPDDWNVGYSITYKNMAALDGLSDKMYDLRMKHYGDQSAEQKVVDKRVENAHTVTSYLLRDVTIK